MFPLPTLPTTMNVLSAMITPAVLILATGSLILTTTNRLVRAIDRVREMLPEFEKLAAQDEHDDLTEQKRAMMFEQLDRATTRARLIQRALSRLYIGLSMFLATSVALGIIAFMQVELAWIPLFLGLIGVGLLFSSSILLIIESQISLASTYSEMDYIKRISNVHAPRKPSQKKRWWNFR